MPINNKTNKYHLFLKIILLSYLLVSCKPLNDSPAPPAPDFQLVAKCDTIRAFPNGGGIIVFKISPTSTFSGTVDLTFEADAALNAKLSRSTLNQKDTAFDISITPSANSANSVYTIKVTAVSGTKTKQKEVFVKIIDWTDTTTDLSEKMSKFRSWIQKFAISYDTIYKQNLTLFATYPISSDTAFYSMLYADYEVRLCYQNTPSNEWSMLSIRDRKKYYAELVLRCNTDGSVNLKSIGDYPTPYGY